jgi:flavin-dependent dehydrogenase
LVLYAGAIKVSAEDLTPKHVAIVGGSAAGLYAAGLLARGGATVTVLEQAPKLDPLRRTLIVTGRLRSLLGAVAEPAVVNHIRRFELFTDGRSATIELSKPDLVIERAALIRSLAEQAQHAGARLEFSRKFLHLEGHASGIRVVSEDSAGSSIEHASMDAVVGADGAASKVAESAGWPTQRTVPLIQAIVKLPRDYAPDVVRVWFVPDDTPYFYWLIPESPTQAAVGLIGEQGAATRQALARFLEKRHLEPTAYQGARIPIFERWVPVERAVGRGRVYLVGDAAGQVKVTTVGGVVTGFYGAAGVAQAILRGDGRKILRRLRRELELHRLIRRALHHFEQSDYSRLVDLLDGGARDSLGQYTRDEAGSVLWHLCRRRPRLLLLGVRGLLTAGNRSIRPA